MNEIPLLKVVEIIRESSGPLVLTGAEGDTNLFRFGGISYIKTTEGVFKDDGNLRVKVGRDWRIVSDLPRNPTVLDLMGLQLSHIEQAAKDSQSRNSQQHRYWSSVSAIARKDISDRKKEEGIVEDTRTEEILRLFNDYS